MKPHIKEIMCHTQCCIALNACCQLTATRLPAEEYNTHWKVCLGSTQSGLNSNARGGVEVLVCVGGRGEGSEGEKGEEEVREES